MTRLSLIAIASLCLAGCFSAELDPSLSQVFACEENEDCSEGQSCLSARCVDEEDIPFVEVVSPALGTAIPISTDGSQIQIPITVRTNLELVPQDDEAPLGLEGYLRGELLGGGAPNVVVEEGSDEVTLNFTLDPTQTPRSLKIAIRAFAANGTEFPNEETLARTVLFLDDGSTPQVAVFEPWPAQSFPVESVSGVQVSVASINYTLRPPTGDVVVPDVGHVHILQSNPDEGAFPAACLVARTDCGEEFAFYTPIAPASETMFFEAPITLNRADPDPMLHRIAAVLVTDIHNSITSPGDMGLPMVVRDQVPLMREPQ